MAKFPQVFTVWTRDATHLRLVREAVQTFNSGISSLCAQIEQEETRAGDVWVTISAADASQVFQLGQRVGKLLEQEGGQSND